MAWAPDRPEPAGGRWPAAERARQQTALVQPPAGPHPANGTELADWAAMPLLQVLRRLNSSPRGLSEQDAQERLARHGENAVLAAGAPGLARTLLRAARDPFVAVLLCLDGVSLVIRNAYSVAVITILAAVSCGLRVREERAAARATAALRALAVTTATVVRRPLRGAPAVSREIPVDQLVPGDIVQVGPGDVVPADVRLVRSASLTVGQADLAGESQPAVKRAGDGAPDGSSVLDCAWLCLAGTSVLTGSGTAVVVATGEGTYLGAARRDALSRRSETCFDRGVRRVSWTLIRLMFISACLVLAANAIWRNERGEALLFVVSVAVGLTPEMLPVVVTTALARAARVMTGGGVIVKRLPALHNLGAMDVLCTDKTGTLTEGRPAVDFCLDPRGQPDPEVLRWAWQNSFWSVEAAGGPVCNSLDEALLGRAEDLGLARDADITDADLVPFDPARRLATVVVRQPGRPFHLLITKGAPEEVLASCSRVATGDGSAALDRAGVKRLAAVAEKYAADGAQVLAVATAEVPARLGHYGPADERGLTLVGFIGFRDRPEASAATALRALAARGIKVKIVTGDHPLLAVRACQQAGIEPVATLTGEDIDRLADGSLARAAASAVVFARVGPEQKARIVRALRAAGHTVGFLGDGVNDVAALRSADVGISVESALDAAREAAEVVLARKDLTALAGAVGQGRRAIANIIKYIKITVSSNAGNVGSMLVAGAVLPFLPMLPLQVLIQNVCFDFSQLAMAFDGVGESSLLRPRTFDQRDLMRFVACFGLVNMLADLATFALLWRTGTHGGSAGRAAFRAGWFTENLLTQALAMVLLRGRHSPSARDRPAWPVLLAAAALGVTGVWLPFSPLAGAIGMQAPPLAFFPLLAAVLGGYCALLLAARTW